jgi:hypothetical protein
MSINDIEARQREHLAKGVGLIKRVDLAKKNGALKSVDADTKQWRAGSDRLKADRRIIAIFARRRRRD